MGVLSDKPRVDELVEQCEGAKLDGYPFQVSGDADLGLVLQALKLLRDQRYGGST